MNVPLLGSGLLGGALATDATAFVQTLVSQPLVGGALAGWLWGDPWTGIEIGALLQLFALAALPLGGHTPDDYATGGIVGPAVAIHAGAAFPTPGPGAAVLTGIGAAFLVAWVGRAVTRWVRGRNEGLTRWAESEVGAGRAAALDHAHALALAHQFLIGAGYTWAALGLALPASRWLLAREGWALGRAAAVAEPALWAVGAGLAVRQLVPLRRSTVLGFLVLLIALLALRGVSLR
jgi:mannose/fructose/N-acetylgalactosamine-specific phosphotransferase system component IIC